MPDTNSHVHAGLLATISALWAKYPDLRLTQLIAMIAGESDPFYVEDNVLYLRACNKLLEEKEWNL